MFRPIIEFLRGDEGQDLADYCLLTALVALIAAGIFVHIAGGIENLWTVANHSITAGGVAATGSASSSGGTH